MGIFIRPLDSYIPLIYTSISESFTTEMKVAIIAGIIAAFPIIVFLIWHFVGPALFPKEKRKILIYVPIAIILFCAGVCFCYFVILPFTLKFFLGVASIEVEAMLSISSYINFLCKILIPFGLVFETPLIVFFLTNFRIVSTKTLGKTRKFVLLACFLLGAIITPPDVISQVCVAAPMYLMYEIGVMLGRLTEKRHRMNETTEKAA